MKKGSPNEIHQQVTRLLIIIISKAHQNKQNLLKTIYLDLKS